MSEVVKFFLQLRQRVRDVQEQGDGWIVALFDYDPKDAASNALLSALHGEGAIKEIRRNGTLLFPPNLGDAGMLELRFDTGNLPGYFESYDSLIRTHPDSTPENLVVWEKNEDLRAGYEAVCKLLLLLKSKAEVWDSTAQRFFLVDQQAVEIPLASYIAKQTVCLPKQLDGILRFLDTAHLDADARWAFFRKASVRLLQDLPSDMRLGSLLENAANILDRAQQDHSLYLERFSFEDLLKNFDEKRLKFVGDLNQVLASIQTALIGVPIGFFLIAEKFKPTNGWTGQNIVLAAGGLVFFALVFLLTLNQGKTLKAVKLALTDFETEQKRKVTDKSERLKNLLATTWSQYGRVRWLLWAVRFLLFLFSAIIVAALLWCSIPAWQDVLPYAITGRSPVPTSDTIGQPKVP
ncbi:MAG: hypothetical protein KDK99_02820 [Verrucomicrobiales bacterium]|nr:hypothetical protein [Verrucomicrobiales bacterium]